MIFLGMIQYRPGAFRIAGRRFDLNQRALALIPNHKVHLEAGVLVEVIQFSPHLGENVRIKVGKKLAA